MSPTLRSPWKFEVKSAHWLHGEVVGVVLHDEAACMEYRLRSLTTDGTYLVIILLNSVG
jgi:hypothetical protein